MPESVEAIMQLPGCSTKTARLVVLEAFGIACGMAVDTLMIGATNALGLIGFPSKDPVHIDYALRKFVPCDYFEWMNYVMGSIVQLLTQTISLSIDIDFFGEMMTRVEDVPEGEVSVYDVLRTLKGILKDNFSSPYEQEMICFIIIRIRSYYRKRGEAKKSEAKKSKRGEAKKSEDSDDDD